MKESKDKALEEIKAVVESGIADREFWHLRTPQERLWAMELMRRKKYGYDESSVPRIKRVFEVVELKRYITPDDPKGNVA